MESISDENHLAKACDVSLRWLSSRFNLEQQIS